jgi:hypothetical protein
MTARSQTCMLLEKINGKFESGVAVPFFFCHLSTLIGPGANDRPFAPQGTHLGYAPQGYVRTSGVRTHLRGTYVPQGLRHCSFVRSCTGVILPVAFVTGATGRTSMNDPADVRRYVRTYV